MAEIVTFGELMLRLSPPGHRRFLQADRFEITFGGSEANVAVALAGYGMGATFVSRLPAHEIGEAALRALRAHGVRTDAILRGGDRLGVYFVETGASQRPSKVIYDRARSAITEIEPADIDWKALLRDKDWFHWSGITPALGAGPLETLRQACRAARAAGVPVSCDLNYRSKLWEPEEARRIMVPLMEYVDVLIANEEDAERSLGFRAGGTDVEAAELDEEGYFRLACELRGSFGFRAVAITLRESFSASVNGWSAILHDDRACREPVRSTRYEIQLVDRVGGGDAFAAGLIYGMLEKEVTRDALEFAVAASCLQQTIPGDFNLLSLAEVEALLASGGSGRVER